MTEPAASGTRPYKGKPIGLRSGATVRHGFTTIMRAGVDHLVRNQRAALNGGGIECVHQMRVALRQLHATLALFKDVAPRDGAANIPQDLKWLRSRLGGARDWDVFETHTLQNVARHTAKPAVAARIAQAVRAPHRAADRRAMAAMDSARYRSFIRTLTFWLAHARWCEQLDPVARSLLDAPLVQAGRPWLRRSARKAHHAGKHIRQLTAKRRHRLRIAVKQLRYDTHSLASLYPAKKVDRYVDALSALQDVLGDLNDFAVARNLLCKIDCGACSFIDEDLALAQVKRLKDLPAAWKVFRRIAPFWKIRH